MKTLQNVKFCVRYICNFSGWSLTKIYPGRRIRQMPFRITFSRSKSVKTSWLYRSCQNSNKDLLTFALLLLRLMRQMRQPQCVLWFCDASILKNSGESYISFWQIEDSRQSWKFFLKKSLKSVGKTFFGLEIEIV